MAMLPLQPRQSDTHRRVALTPVTLTAKRQCSATGPDLVAPSADHHRLKAQLTVSATELSRYRGK